MYQHSNSNYCLLLDKEILRCLVDIIIEVSNVRVHGRGRILLEGPFVRKLASIENGRPLSVNSHVPSGAKDHFYEIWRSYYWLR